jgi:hypothetical protein
MTVNRLQDTPFIFCSKSRGLRQQTSTLKWGGKSGMYDIERLTEDIDASLRGELGKIMQ